MKIDTMRYIDYWAGIPLCFIASMINGMAQFFKVKKQNRKEGEPKKILLIKLSEMGAIVLAYPLINKLKNSSESSEIFFLTFRKNKDVFKILDHVIDEGNILTIRDDGIGSFLADRVTLASEIAPQPRLFVLLLGESADDRKSTGLNKTVGFFRSALEDFHVCLGVGSAEGLQLRLEEKKKSQDFKYHFYPIDKPKSPSWILRENSAIAKIRNLYKKYATLSDRQISYNLALVFEVTHIWTISPEETEEERQNRLEKWQETLRKRFKAIDNDSLYSPSK